LLKLARGRASIWVALVALLLLAGCGSTGFHVKDLAKSDIDIVADTHRNQVQLLLDQLLVKLYKRNPRELRKTPLVAPRQPDAVKPHLIQSKQQGLQQSLVQCQDIRSEERYRSEVEQALLAMNRALDDSFEGDRVFLLMQGLQDMISLAYNCKREFFVLDQLSEQKLYHSARNIEILVWRLRTQVDTQGRPLLYTNSLDGEPSNLSFERLFGKLIQIQDMMAAITASRTQRTIAYVTKSVASMTFIPL